MNFEDSAICYCFPVTSCVTQTERSEAGVSFAVKKYSKNKNNVM